MPVYAVARGKEVGIYKTWAECSMNTQGYPGAVYKKLDSVAEAENYITDYNNKIATKNVIQKENKSTTLLSKSKLDMTGFEADYYVYTDGACSNNGHKSAQAGIGIYFGQGDPRNVSIKVEGKQSNNTAELGALRHLYGIIRADLAAGKKICIVSDSEYAIKCVTTYGEKCAEGGWKKDMPNKELVQETYNLYKDIDGIRFMHIMAHTGRADIHSIGNDGADNLANMAIGIDDGCPYSKPKQGFTRRVDKIYLNVPYARKDEAKEQGAKWDPSAKKWWVSSDCPNKDDLIAEF
jgi:ribonuclease HI